MIQVQKSPQGMKLKDKSEGVTAQYSKHIAWFASKYQNKDRTTTARCAFKS